MQIRFLLGPSGTGKTFRCLAEIRTALLASPTGPPLLFLAPKQATFQLERQLLADPNFPGYTRLQILSFDQLAELLLTEFEQCSPELLNEEGRLMVLRALLNQKRDQLKLFRSSARLRGFAQQLSNSLRELQRSQVSAEQILSLAGKIGPENPLLHKLQDLAALLRAYQDWLKQHDLQDNDLLLDLATASLLESPLFQNELRTAHEPTPSPLQGGEPATGASNKAPFLGGEPATDASNEAPLLGGEPATDASNEAPLLGGAGGGFMGMTQPRDEISPHSLPDRKLHIAGLWFDGFAELAPQEISLLTALLHHCDQATLAFNLDRDFLGDVSWLSPWSSVGLTFQKLHQRLATRPDADVHIEWLERKASQSRFANNPILQHLEKYWAHPKPFSTMQESPPSEAVSRESCHDPLNPPLHPSQEGNLHPGLQTKLPSLEGNLQQVLQTKLPSLEGNLQQVLQTKLPSLEGNLQQVLQTKLPSSEGPGVGSWPVSRSERNMNLQVGRVTPCAPFEEYSPTHGAHGVTRPTTVPSAGAQDVIENLAVLTGPPDTLSPSDGERTGVRGVPFPENSGLEKTLRIALCANPEAEAILAATEILNFVRRGGRFREVAVVVRQLENYYEAIRRVFTRYEIPFFLDRREPMGHHPIVELTRNAIRTIAFGWESEDWFGALKTGLVHANDTEIDRLENEALAHGWKGQDWLQPLTIPDDPDLAQQLELLRQRLVRPFQQLAAVLLESPSRKPTPSPLPGGEPATRASNEAPFLREDPATGAANEAPLLGGAGGGFMGRENLQDLEANRGREPTPSPLPGREPANEAPLLGGAGGGFMGRAQFVLEPGAFYEPVRGAMLAMALREFWKQLKVGEQLQEWTAQSGNPAHTTLWEQMHRWLDNLALAFSQESLSLKEWLPILEAGLSSQTVGVIPPALDQVLVGAIDRSRNPDLNLAIVLGMNESVFPAAPIAQALLTESDREQLSQLGVDLGPKMRARIGQEQYLGYIACTRARQRLVLTYAARDENDKTLNPSPFLAQLRRLFPTLEVEAFSASRSWLASEHPSELIGPLLKSWRSANTGALRKLSNLAPFTALRERFEHSRPTEQSESLSPSLAERLYGHTLRTSVSALEEFAACPFKFFVSSGLKADERKMFELDARELGSFQHEILARFHQQLRKEGKRWRDLTPRESRARIGTIAAELIPHYREGLFQATDQSSFTARSITASLQNFIETIVGWMSQYEFDPHAVELAFGIEEKPLPAWELDLGEGRYLSFRGKIDRVDLWRAPNAQSEALCVVIDYKSSAKKLDPILVAHGVQLQLPAYLNVLRSLPDPRAIFGVERLIPAGVFYVNLRGTYEGGKTRRKVLTTAKEARRSAYRHTGRFDGQMLAKLDRRTGVTQGDQFGYRLTDSGRIHGASREVMSAEEFATMLDSVEGHLKGMGQAIYAGVTKVDPYRKGCEIACAKCDYLSICRIDPWTHQYRDLRKIGA